MAEKKYYGTVLLKADVILDYLYTASTPQVLSKIAEKTGLTKSTLSKILETLEFIGYVSRNNENKTYTLGSKFIKYSSKQLESYQFDHSVLAKIDELYEKFDETVHLGVFQNDKIVTTKKLQSSKSVVCISSEIGESKDLYSSAMGKAVLAEMDDKQLFKYINDHDFIPKTDKTIASTQKLLSELVTIRSNGYSIDNEENEEGVYCIGVTISKEQTNNSKDIIGAFSVSIPIYRATTETVDEIVDHLLSVKQSIRDKLV